MSKISWNLMRIVELNGGRISYKELYEWISTLESLGFLEKEEVKEDGKMSVDFVLGEKGKIIMAKSRRK